MLIDRFGRQVTYLRVSVTDRCNLRCVYCMPPEGITWKEHNSILSYEEIIQVVKAAAQEGVSGVRLTGGEPLVRRDLPDLVRAVAAVPGIRDVSLTTNAILLEGMAAELAEAGLKRINVSLDSLKPELFARITRGGSLDKVMRGIRAAEGAGMRPIKVNAVIMRGVNDEELESLALLTMENDWHVRFIEIMPVRNQAPWGEGFPDPVLAYYPVHDMKMRLEPLGLHPVHHMEGQGPAELYQLQGAKGVIGLISPIGQKFCEKCNRLRLTADGTLRPCLLTDNEISVLPTLRAGGDITALLREAVLQKPEGHELEAQHSPNGRCMIQIGG